MTQRSAGRLTEHGPQHDAPLVTLHQTKETMMATTKRYRISFMRLFTCSHDAGMVIGKFIIGRDVPHPSMQTQTFEAAGLPDMLAKVAEFAARVPCAVEAGVACLDKPKPAGFEAATRRLRFNMERIVVEGRNGLDDMGPIDDAGDYIKDSVAA